MLNCKHILTIGDYCKDCGKKVFGREINECHECNHYKESSTGESLCKKHMMWVTKDMHVTFKVEDGSCFLCKQQP